MLITTTIILKESWQKIVPWVLEKKGIFFLKALGRDPDSCGPGPCAPPRPELLDAPWICLPPSPQPHAIQDCPTGLLEAYYSLPNGFKWNYETGSSAKSLSRGCSKPLKGCRCPTHPAWPSGRPQRAGGRGSAATPAPVTPEPPEPHIEGKIHSIDFLHAVQFLSFLLLFCSF